MVIFAERLKSGKVKLSCEGEYLFSLPDTVWYSSGYSNGDDIDEEELLSLKEEGNSSFAFESALRYLSLRSYSRKELLTKLKMKYGKDPSEKAVEKCLSLGLINDEQYAIRKAEDLYRSKSFSVGRIRMELASKGIERDIIEIAVNSLDIDKNQAIINVLNKMHLSFPLNEKDRNRAVRRLANLGYSISDIFKVLGTMGDNSEDENFYDY